jgi:hemoglobin
LGKVTEDTPYSRLGGYDKIDAVARSLFARLSEDPQLARFWETRSTDTLAAAAQLMVLYLSEAAGGPAHYLGRDLATAHKGLRITPEEWDIYMRHARAALEEEGVSGAEFEEVYGFLLSHKEAVVDS